MMFNISRRGRQAVALQIVLILCGLTYFLTKRSVFTRLKHLYQTPLQQVADSWFANATLGFEKIVAISSENASSPAAWRIQGLTEAAALNGLTFSLRTSSQDEVPLSWYSSLPPASGAEKERLSIKYALSLKAHIEALENIIARGFRSALILEDDADWDVRIREQLKPNGTIAEALRSLSATEDIDVRSRESGREVPILPYGLDWDVILLGHCGHEVGGDTTQIAADDSTMIDPSKYRSLWSETHYQSIPLGHRLVLGKAATICTYAYAVTQQGARRVVELNKWDTPFDVFLLVACKDEKLKCNVVAPELFHHQAADLGRPGLDQGLSGEDSVENFMAKPEHFTTMNIVYSSRCNARKWLGGSWDGDLSALVQCVPSDEDFITHGA